MTRRHWPTLAREAVAGDVVYVGLRLGVIVAVIDGGWRVRYLSGPDHELRPRGMFDPECPAVVDEADPMVAAPCLVMRERTRHPHREPRAAPLPAPRRIHQAPAQWVYLDAGWWWGASTTGVYVRDGGDSTRDVHRAPVIEDAHRALARVPSCASHRGLRELDGEERREAAGYQPDPLERVFEVLR